MAVFGSMKSGNINTNSVGAASFSHAEGDYAMATGQYSHAEGCNTIASGKGSHAEGWRTEAAKNYSHASGYSTCANAQYSFVCGKYNAKDTDVLFSVGNGTIGTESDADANRKTIFKITTSDNVIATGSMFAAAFYESSDATKKDIVSNLDVDFDKLKQIPKVNFTWKNDTEKKNNIGTIAQDLNKVYPELVNGEEGNMTVDYAKLSIIALAAIDKLEDRIKQLEDKLQQYEK